MDTCVVRTSAVWSNCAYYFLVFAAFDVLFLCGQFEILSGVWLLSFKPDPF